MSEISKINQSISLPKINREHLLQDQNEQDKKVSTSFADTISDFLTTVNKTQQEAGTKVADIVTGKSEDLVSAMATLEESRLSFQLMLEIRNKLLDAFKEIQRMQV